MIIDIKKAKQKLKKLGFYITKERDLFIGCDMYRLRSDELNVDDTVREHGLIRYANINFDNAI
jgi:hypothetical protein